MYLKGLTLSSLARSFSNIQHTISPDFHSGRVKCGGSFHYYPVFLIELHVLIRRAIQGCNELVPVLLLNIGAMSGGLRPIEPIRARQVPGENGGC